MNISTKELSDEKKYLKYVIKIIRNDISNLGQELYDRKEKVLEFKKFVWNSKQDMDPTEMKVMINANDLEVALMTNKSNHLQKLYRIQDHPYFGSITFKDENETRKIYIGITHVNDKDGDIHLIYDWRAPICSMFYDYELGKAKYLSPGGIIEGEIINKRQFNIKNGILVRVFDNDINIDDELLQEVLTEETNEKMKNIVNTIQKEQNSIIRNIEDKNLIVQGIAGSGKTSVALHRIAFLLYKITNLNSNNILIFSPNQVFIEYISNVLPELGEQNTMQTTFNEFLSANLPEYKLVESFTSFVERFYKYKEKNPSLIKYKQSDKIITDIENYITNFINNIEFIEDLSVNGIEVSKQELNNLLKDRYKKLLMLDRIEEIADKICRDFCNGKKNHKKSFISRLTKNLNASLDFKKIFEKFFSSSLFKSSYGESLTEYEVKKMVNQKEIKYEDACLLVYIKGMIRGFSYNGLIKEIVIDEAQDYNRLQYILIKKIFRKSNFTILGDVNQTINPYYKYESLKNISDIIGEETKYIELNKTYRSTPEIIEHTNKILNLEHISAIRKKNNQPIIFRQENNNIKKLLIDDIKVMQKSNLSIAIITKTDEEAEYIYSLLKSDLKINIIYANTSDFNKKMIVVPAYIAKGLEFDAVIVYTKKDNKYLESEKYLYYVACTRAQHKLIIYNQN